MLTELVLKNSERLGIEYVLENRVKLGIEQFRENRDNLDRKYFYLRTEKGRYGRDDLFSTDIASTSAPDTSPKLGTLL